MNKKWKKDSNALKEIVDNNLIRVLEKENAVCSFYKLSDHILKELNIRLVKTTKLQLTIYSNDVLDYQKITSIWFYFKELIRLDYICFVKLPIIDNGNLEIGKLNSICQNGVLSEEVSNFFISNYNNNIVISPELNSYVKAEHQTQELCEAKKSRIIALCSMILSIISVIISLFF